MKIVFVTGASSFLGNNLLVYLLQNKYKVIAFVRSEKNLINLKHENLKIVLGELADVKLLEKYIKQSNYVVHTAANTSQSLLKLKDYHAVNFEATRIIVELCKSENIEKLVYIGTANTYGFGSEKEPGHELSPMKYPFSKSLYALSKVESLTYIRAASKELNISILSPTFMLGGLDYKPSSGQLVLSALNKWVVFYPKGGKNFIHVMDVVKCVEESFTHSESSEEIILANENLSYKSFFKKLIKYNQQKSILIKIPNSLLYLAGLLGELIRFLGFETQLSKANTKILMVNNYYSNAKAKQSFNTSFLPTDRAVVDSVDWFNLKS